MWQLIPQIEKVGKDEEREVLCKLVRFFPVEDKQTKELRFFKLRDKDGNEYTCLKVIIQHHSGTKHTITWSDYAGKGRYTYKWNVRGEKDDVFFSAPSFWLWMAKTRPDIADEVKSAFDGRKLEIGITLT